MRLSEIAHKELVDFNEGGSFWGGPVGGRADLMIDESSGAINSLVLEKGRFMGFSQGEEIIIPWSAIIKVGKDVIILDINPQKKQPWIRKEVNILVVNKIPLGKILIIVTVLFNKGGASK